ncbi:hypothetical protein CH063_13255, partial [Colletotrichum higginsianum]
MAGKAAAGWVSLRDRKLFLDFSGDSPVTKVKTMVKTVIAAVPMLMAWFTEAATHDNPLSPSFSSANCLQSLTYPSTFNINNIFYTYANNLIFSSELLFDLMGQYTEDEVNQALDAITNGMPIKRAGQVQEAKLAEWVRIQHALGVAPTHLQ